MDNRVLIFLFPLEFLPHKGSLALRLEGIQPNDADIYIYLCMYTYIYIYIYIYICILRERKR